MCLQILNEKFPYMNYELKLKKIQEDEEKGVYFNTKMKEDLNVIENSDKESIIRWVMND